MACTDDNIASSYARKTVEMLFSYLKRFMGLDRLRLRGPNDAKDDFHLAATGLNPRKLAKLRPMPATMAVPREFWPHANRRRHTVLSKASPQLGRWGFSS
jgi:hypothetical protein